MLEKTQEYLELPYLGLLSFKCGPDGSYQDSCAVSALAFGPSYISFLVGPNAGANRAAFLNKDQARSAQLRWLVLEEGSFFSLFLTVDAVSVLRTRTASNRKEQEKTGQVDSTKVFLGRKAVYIGPKNTIVDCQLTGSLVLRNVLWWPIRDLKIKATIDIPWTRETGSTSIR